ncbi:hypothetical protein [Kordia jejudonensis]|uniref:hypothetical protein n=1 Tax=Kordia jejudonensis TaxID=1348245 RepID=UPI0006292F2F|nr:hypothetical protein [Kordia jejudonensis]
MKKVESFDRTLKIDGKEFELEYNIKQVRIINKLAVVIYKFDENVPKHLQFKNCKAFDENGKLIWIAEHPMNTPADFYIEFNEGTENQIWNFCGFLCTLDFENGKLKKSEFNK